ncbi:MAG TPA: iron uptake system protein EfeO [Jatrophihabitantaceae bacterium]|nr:iron uptake system protein EfeO [Jatrophihabitantaceae bacterium]
MFRRIRAEGRILAAVGAAAVGLTACSSSAGGDPQSTPPSASSRTTVEVTAAKGCTPDRTEFRAGGITFDVTNKDATAVTEIEVFDGDRIIGEKENLPPGFSGSFTITASAGTYTLYCPGARVENVTLTVTDVGSSSATNTSGADVAALLKTGVAQYATYVNDQVARLLAASKRLDEALTGKNLAAAQKAYIDARPFYEKIEPVAESFTVGKDSIDADIDARANDVPAAEWRGFHRIEKGLFTDKSLTGLAPYGTRLVADVAKLQSLTAKLSYQPTELANGAQELLDEVAASKITGEEERYSRIDVLDIAFNVAGSRQAFTQLEPALKKIDAALAGTIDERFDALAKLIDTYRTTADPSGFVRYTALTVDDKRTLAAAVKAVQEPLSRVASKVAG